MHQLHLVVLVFLLFLQRNFFVNGISCYKCQSVSSSSLCISDVGSPSVCEKQYCTIYRQEYLDPKGKVQNFYRSCEDKPTYLNAIIKTPNYRTYYRACTSDFCNTGDGIEEFKIEFKNASSMPIYIVPGIGSTGETLLSYRKLIITLISFAIFLS